MAREEMGQIVNDDDLDLKYVAVKFRRKHYVLCEAGAGDVMKWRSLQFQDARYDREGNPTERRVKDVFESQTFLVSLCLYETDRPGSPPLNKDGDLDTEKRRPLEWVRTVPERLMDEWLDAVLTMSNLRAKPTKEKSEADFVAACVALAGWVEKPEEANLWRDWMTGEVEKAIAAAPARKRESAEKNGLPATTASSAS